MLTFESNVEQTYLSFELNVGHLEDGDVED